MCRLLRRWPSLKSDAVEDEPKKDVSFWLKDVEMGSETVETWWKTFEPFWKTQKDTCWKTLQRCWNFVESRLREGHILYLKDVESFNCMSKSDERVLLKDVESCWEAVERCGNLAVERHWNMLRDCWKMLKWNCSKTLKSCWKTVDRCSNQTVETCLNIVEILFKDVEMKRFKDVEIILRDRSKLVQSSFK